jgi:lipopolysaccharide export system protein LptA
VDRAPAGSRSKQALLTVVRAPDLEYFEETRVAHYRGGVALDRPGLQVDSRELRAFLKDSSSDSSLDRAVAEGAVKIVGSSRDSRDKRTRTGLGERAEYFAGDQKVVLEGGEPRLIDSQKGTATGRQLIWFVDNDRLLVNGEERKPAVTSIRKK